VNQVEQEAIAKYNECYNPEKRVIQMTESELIQLVKRACREAIEEIEFKYIESAIPAGVLMTDA
jgi:hypothetical protein